MANHVVPRLEFPPSDPKHERALGQFIIAWGQLEAEIDCAIEELFDVAEPLDNVLTANLMTKAKLDIFRAAMSSLASLWRDGMLDLANKLVNETVDAANKFRTHYAHGQPIAAQGADGIDVWVWIKRAARKQGVTIKSSSMTEQASDFARFAATGLIVRWHEMREAIAVDRSKKRTA